jgi:glycosyltransferase
MSRLNTSLGNNKVSVITVVKNGAATIEDCIRSVRRQDHPVEHVFVDGQSCDGTVEIIKRHYPDISKIISEPDAGIYDAMNKGISLSTGEVVGILNSDDFYAHDKVISTITNVFADKDVDACYGDLVYVNAERTDSVIRYWKSRPVADWLLYCGWMPPHPTLFVRRKLYEKFGYFRTDLGSAADYELILRFFLKNRIRAVHIPQLLVAMRAGGASNATLSNRFMVNLWVYKAWRINGLTPRPWMIPARLLSKLVQYYRGRWGAGRLAYQDYLRKP